jgi:CRISPR-associated endonuclease/helicase Cas3
MTYPEYFRELTGHPPYDFQKQLGDRLLNGESLIFRAPTGAGKTWTTVAPFLYSIQQGQRIADRLIYALPLRALASALHTTVTEALAKTHPIATNAKDREYPSNRIYCSLQMGGEKNDPFFEGDLVFCTIDQVLSGYLTMPMSLPDRVGNMVAGALPGALLILDEVHLLESGIALGTVIEMLDRFRGLIQFVLMTATMSDASMDGLAAKLGASVPELSPAEIANLPVQKTKKRIWNWNPRFLGIDDIKAAHQGGRTLVIVNRVEQAQNLYHQLREKYAYSATRLACLHAQFFPEDRARTERDIQPWFGKDATEDDVILITTQVVEAGIDISADHILTELAPMNALVQRAGRTARYVDRYEGTVNVFEVENDKPYGDADGELTRTREALARLSPGGEHIGFEREQEWIEFVHGEVERGNLAQYRSLSQRRMLVNDALVKGDRGRLSDLVRNVDTVNILLSSNPDNVNFSGKSWPRLLSIPRTSVWKLADAPQVWKATECDEESGPIRFRWLPVATRADLKGCWLLAVGPQAASYCRRVGLRLGQPGAEIPVHYSESAPVPRYWYVYETWTDHVRKVIGQAKNMAQSHAVAGRRFGALALFPETAETLVELSAALHDVGKLAKKWQEEAWAWETARTGRIRRDAIAHTTKAPEERGPALPPHAVEGAFAVSPFLQENFPDTWWAVVSAVARHHSSRASRLQEFALIAGAKPLTQDVGVDGIAVRSGKPGLDFTDFSGDLDTMDKIWPLYAWLVRRLRLADQAGTAEGVREGGSAR